MRNLGIEVSPFSVEGVRQFLQEIATRELVEKTNMARAKANLQILRKARKDALRVVKQMEYQMMILNSDVQP